MPFIELQSIDSTNNYARQLIHDGLAQHGMAIFAQKQNAGKGQRGKSWDSEKGLNIMMSMLIKPWGIRLDQQFYLNACVAVAVHEFFSRYAGDDTKIKWPNDLYWQNRKAGGILIENIIRGSDLDWAIVGIGININQTNFPSHLPNPVSLKQITGKNFDVVALAKKLHIELNNKFNLLNNDDPKAVGFESIYNNYLSHLYKKDQTVKLKKDNRMFETVIKTVSPLGKLIVHNTIEEEFDFGEIEWVL